MTLRRILREPLVHFLVAGAVIFAWSQWRGEPVDPAERTIEVGRDQQARIALDFERTMQRPPTDAELDGLIGRWVREEVLYREALRLGLDSDDPVVRRRLAKKMDFLAASEADLAQPTDAELEEWYARNADRFADTGRLTFQQRYFVGERNALAALENGGEGVQSSLPARLVDAPYRDVSALFGSAFLGQVTALSPAQEWQGPVRSGLGWHLVKLEQASGNRAPPLAEVRTRAVEEWRLARAETLRAEAYRLLEEAYTVEISE